MTAYERKMKDIEDRLEALEDRVAVLQVQQATADPASHLYWPQIDHSLNVNDLPPVGKK